MDRLSPLDVSFLHVEDEVTHMHLGSVGLFEGPPPTEDELLRAIEGKLHLAPRWRQRVRFVPLQAGRPVWVDDPHFNLRYHVRRTGLPSPGGDAELRRLVGRVMSRQLDRDRPLWELWVVEGLGDDRWAVISKLHHAMVDGVSGSNLITVLLDEERDPRRAQAPAWSPARRAGGRAARRRRAAGARALAAARGARRPSTRSATRAAGPSMRRRPCRASSPTRASRGARRPPGSTARSGRTACGRAPGRSSATSRRSAPPCTARSTTSSSPRSPAASATFMFSRGEDVAHDRTLRTLVPVSVRARGQSGAYDNRVSAMFADLPVGIEDPVARLRLDPQPDAPPQGHP